MWDSDKEASSASIALYHRARGYTRAPARCSTSQTPPTPPTDGCVTKVHPCRDGLDRGWIGISYPSLRKLGTRSVQRRLMLVGILYFVAAPPTTEGHGQTSLYMMQADGSNVVKLTTGDQMVFAPTWSPDGTQIAFTLVDGDQGDIAIMQLADRRYRNITNTDDVREMNARWSPDGQWIVFESDGGHFAQSGILIIRPNGADRTQLTDIHGVNSTPSWSPDGSQIVFISDRDFKLRDLNQQPSLVSLLLCQKIPDLELCSVEQDRYGTAIYVMNADGSNVRRLTDSIGWKWLPIWRR
jgi:Tol biopolymer transport system component